MKVRFLKEIHYKQYVFLKDREYEIDNEVLEACKGDYEIIEKYEKKPEKDKMIKAKDVKTKEE
ncbi:MAG: hypothetical protein QXF86_03285 [Candidatus Bilamarchaeaceae archaeon]